MMWSEKLLNSYNAKWDPAGGAYKTLIFEDTDKTVTYRGKTHTIKKYDIISPIETELLPPDRIRSTMEETYTAISMICILSLMIRKPCTMTRENWFTTASLRALRARPTAAI